MKVLEGGWFPLVVAALIFFLMTTWRQGRDALLRVLERDTFSLTSFIGQVHNKTRVPGTAVYVTSRVDVVPVPLLHNLKHNKVLHERIVLLRVADREYSARGDRNAASRSSISPTISTPSPRATASWSSRTFRGRSRTVAPGTWFSR